MDYIKGDIIQTPEVINQTLESIASEHLLIDTLETRHSDGHDFHDVSVWGIKAALQAAYEAGKASSTG